MFEGGQGNLYVYVGNAPASFRDVNGRFLVGLAGLGVVVGSGVSGAVAAYAFADPNQSGIDTAVDVALGFSLGMASGIGGLGLAAGEAAIFAVYGGTAIVGGILHDTRFFTEPGGVGDFLAGTLGGALCDSFAGGAGPFLCPFASEAASKASEGCRK